MTNPNNLFVSQKDNFDGLTRAEISEVRDVLEKLFKGKRPSVHKKFIGTGGVPGAGKSRYARQLARENPNAVLVDVNDNCLCAIPGYQRDLAERGFEYAYEKWRNASNWISINANKRALDEGYDLIAVGTAASPFALKLFEEAKSKGYTVTIAGFSAPVDICLERNKAENRKTDMPENERVLFLLPENHVTDKRQPYFDNIPGIVGVADTFIQYWNPANGIEPVEAFRVSDGGAFSPYSKKTRRLEITDGSAARKFISDAGWDKKFDSESSLNSILKWNMRVPAGKQPKYKVELTA